MYSNVSHGMDQLALVGYFLHRLKEPLPCLMNTLCLQMNELIVVVVVVVVVIAATYLKRDLDLEQLPVHFTRL